MTPEQKQRIAHEISNWRNARNDHSSQITGDRMSALLQELVDAPGPEPFAVIHLDGSFVHVEFKQPIAGTGKFEVYAAPSVPDVANTFKRRAEEIVAMAVNRENYAKINRTIADLVTDIANAAEAPTPADVLIATNPAQISSLAAPAPKPVARVTGYYAGYLSIATVDGRVLPAGTALYAAPPHQSEHHLEMVNTPAPSVPVEPMENIALNEWLDKTEWMQKEINTFPVSSLGMHRADVMRLEIERLRKLLSAAPTPAELLKTTNSVQISSSQVEAPADLVRDAERWLSEHDLELLVTFGMQADDCDADGHTLSKEQTRRLCELGVLRNVGFGRHEMTAFGDSIFGVYFSQGISLPLQTHAEYNAAIDAAMSEKGQQT